MGSLLSSQRSKSQLAIEWREMDKRNIVVLVHGYGEHLFRPQYTKLTQFLEAIGWEVRKHTIREHWNGDPDHTEYSFYFDKFSDPLTDLADHVREIAEEVGVGKANVVVVGKSLGGLIAIRFLEELPDELEEVVRGAVALAPCLAIGAKYDSPAKRALAYFMIDYLRMTWFYSPFDQLLPADVTRNTYEYNSDPHILSRGVWAGVAVATRNETFLAHERRDSLQKDLLILHGTDDLVTECSASRDFAEHTSQYCQIETYKNTAHDLLDEDSEVLDQIYKRIAAFLSPLASTASLTELPVSEVPSCNGTSCNGHQTQT